MEAEGLTIVHRRYDIDERPSFPPGAGKNYGERTDCDISRLVENMTGKRSNGKTTEPRRVGRVGERRDWVSYGDPARL
jgi:hypothetical protein